MSKLKSIEMRGADSMKTRNRTAKLILCVILAIVLTFSGELMSSQITGSGFGVMQAQAATVRLNRTRCVLDIGKTMYLKMVGTKSKPKWYTSNKSVVAVNSKGLITAKKTGSAIITAKLGNKSYRCRIRVTDKERFRNYSGRQFDGKSYFNRHCGADGKGLYRYDILSGKRKKLSSLYPVSIITVSGDYVYFDAWSSDLRYRNIYRVSKYGGKPHRLAKGLEPVVVGKHIYYVTYDGTNVYKRTAIYRMDLNGNNKKCIYKNGNGTYASCKGIYKGQYVMEVTIYYDDDTTRRDCYAIDSSGHTDWVYISSYYMHGNWTSLVSKQYDSNYYFDASDNTYGYVYDFSGNKLIRKSGYNSKVLHTFPSDIADIIDYGTYLEVTTRGKNVDTYNLYFISASGKTVRKILTNEGYVD